MPGRYFAGDGAVRDKDGDIQILGRTDGECIRHSTLGFSVPLSLLLQLLHAASAPSLPVHARHQLVRVSNSLHLTLVFLSAVTVQTC